MKTFSRINGNANLALYQSCESSSFRRDGVLHVFTLLKHCVT